MIFEIVKVTPSFRPEYRIYRKVNENDKWEFFSGDFTTLKQARLCLSLTVEHWKKHKDRENDKSIMESIEIIKHEI